MKKSITNYLYALSEDDMDILYEIIAMKYRKFIQLYWLLKDFSNNIIKLKYKEKTEKNILKIVVGFSDINVNNVVDRLQNEINKSDRDITVELSDNEIIIIISKDEVV